MSYRLQLSLDSLPKSLNIKLRSNRFKNHKENKSWDLMIACEVSNHGKPKTPLKKAHITLIRHSNRTLDYDGLVGSMKPVVDALVSCGVLKDDSWNVLGKWNVDQKFRPLDDGPLLEVIIEGLPFFEPQKRSKKPKAIMAPAYNP